MCSNIKIRKCWVSNWTNMSNFHPLEVVSRGSETQFQVGEYVNYLIQRLWGWTILYIMNCYPNMMRFLKTYWEPLWLRPSVLDLRPPVFNVQILDASVIIISSHHTHKASMTRFRLWMHEDDITPRSFIPSFLHIITTYHDNRHIKNEWSHQAYSKWSEWPQWFGVYCVTETLFVELTDVFLDKLISLFKGKQDCRISVGSGILYFVSSRYYLISSNSHRDIWNDICNTFFDTGSFRQRFSECRIFWGVAHWKSLHQHQPLATFRDPSLNMKLEHLICLDS